MRLNFTSTVLPIVVGVCFLSRAHAQSEVPPASSSEAAPVATQWLLDSLGTTGRSAVQSVFKIVCSKTNSKGTGFALDTGYLITNAHVVEGCESSDLQIFSASGKLEPIVSLITDTDRDLAVMRFKRPIADGLKIDKRNHAAGVQVSTWGHPLAYNGPPPILTMGYISGFAYEPTPATPAVSSKTVLIRQLILNAAINPGNSGGPLLCDGHNDVVAVIVSKHAPMPQGLRNVIQTLAKNEFGMTFTATEPGGKTKSFSESQLVAEVLTFFQSMTQVVIGQAIAASELVTFLDQNKIPWTAAPTPAITPSVGKGNTPRR